MKTRNKRPRKLMRARNRDRVNRLQKQQTVLEPLFVLVLIKLALEEVKTGVKMQLRLTLHIDKLTGNAFFPTTTPPIAVLQTLADDLGETIIAIDAGNLALIPHRETLMLSAENVIRQLSYDIQKQSEGDAEKIQSAGFEVRKGKGASHEVDKPLNLRTAPTGPGKVKLRYKKIAYSRMNFIEMSSNPATGTWTPIGKTSRSSFDVTGLTPGALYYFRVYGSNNLGDGPPSDPAEQRSL